MNNADLIVATLKAAGIDRGFGIPSGNVLPLMEAMRKGGVDFVLTAHEGSAGFAADVTGRMTGSARPLHRHARPRRDQSHHRRRQRLARPLAAHRHHLQPEHRPARPPHPDVDRPPRAVCADHQGVVPAGEGQDRRDREGGHPHRHERAARAGASRSAGGRGAGAGARGHGGDEGAVEAVAAAGRRHREGRRTDRQGQAADRRARLVGDAARQSGSAAAGRSSGTICRSPPRRWPRA